MGRKENTEPALLGGRCKATRRDGTQCENAPMLGLTVCSMHGGKVPALREKALERLIDSSPRAVERVLEMLEDDKDSAPCPFCKRGMKRAPDVVLKAAFGVLDRSGLGTEMKLQVTGQLELRYVQYLTDEELEQLDAIIERAKERAQEELGETGSGGLVRA